MNIKVKNIFVDFRNVGQIVKKMAAGTFFGGVFGGVNNLISGQPFWRGVAQGAVYGALFTAPVATVKDEKIAYPLGAVLVLALSDVISAPGWRELAASAAAGCAIFHSRRRWDELKRLEPKSVQP